jgi:hypothetical protein
METDGGSRARELVKLMPHTLRQVPSILRERFRWLRGRE